jgi:hypothetical protein
MISPRVLADIGWGAAVFPFVIGVVSEKARNDDISRIMTTKRGANRHRSRRERKDCIKHPGPTPTL